MGEDLFQVKLRRTGTCRRDLPGHVHIQYVADMPDFDWSNWTSWSILSELDLKVVPSDPGVYVIAAGRTFSRVVGDDPEGILDIGESVGLRQRLRDFIRCATNRGQVGHMAGWRYAFFRFDRLFPFATLRVPERRAPLQPARSQRMDSNDRESLWHPHRPWQSGHLRTFVATFFQNSHDEHRCELVRR